MITILFYNLILLCSTFFIFLSEKSRTFYDRYILVFIAFLIIFLPSALRYGVGTDYFNYLEIYKNLSETINIEYGFYYISKFLKFLDADSQWLIAILSFIITAALFLGLPKKYGWLMLLTYLLLLYLNSFNTIRQAISIVFAMWALKLYVDNKIFWFTILLIFGSLFHKSILILIPVGYIALIPFTKLFTSYISFVIIVIFSIFIYFKSEVIIHIIEFILNMTNIEKYILYFSNSVHFAEREHGTGIGMIVKILFSLYFLLMGKYVIKENKRYLIIILLSYLYVISSLISFKIIIFERMQLIFIISLVYCVYILWKIGVYKKLNKIVIILFITFLWLAFLKDSYGASTTYGDPKINPYQSILDK